MSLLRILYYDCFSGISGDMNLGAMIDLGLDPEYLKNELHKLKIDKYQLKVSKDQRHGIFGTKVDVITEKTEKHRHISDIENIISSSSLNDEIKELSLLIFRKIAIAEAKVHNTPVEKVHFHEVGAVDSIVDIVGAAIAINYFKPDKIIASVIEVGGGFVKCAHGTLPVPAPATAEILKGIPVRLGTVDFEATTPTGAAILAATVNEFTDKPGIKIEKTGYGVGHKKGNIPNLLRVYVGELIEESALPEKSYTNHMIECNIDDMNPEHYEYVIEKLFDTGANDVFLTPVIMKKSRPGIKISVLCSKKNIETLKNILLTETTSIGIRDYKVNKTSLERKFSDIKTKWGKVKIKSSWLNGVKVHVKPEYEDCKEIARTKNISLDEVMKEIMKSL